MFSGSPKNRHFALNHRTQNGMYRTRVCLLERASRSIARRVLHTQCGGAAQNMADETHYSVVDDAFGRSGLVPPPGEAVTPLGIQPIDKYIYEMLMLAGIRVELQS